MFSDCDEHTRRKNQVFTPTKLTMSQIRAAIPPRLFERSTFQSSLYVARNLAIIWVLYKLALCIDAVALGVRDNLGSTVERLVRLLLWLNYWWWQSLAFSGLWIFGHEGGHGALSKYKWFSHGIGFFAHSFLLTPYFSWRRTHHNHHKATGSLERDENFVPRTRSDYGLPPENNATPIDYSEAFEDAPIFILARMLFMQLTGWYAYLFFNLLGSPAYPSGTNHIFPSSPLFMETDRNSIIISNISVGTMLALLYRFSSLYGFAALTKLYIIPYMITNHWIVLITFLQHTDPTIPHYRNSQWSFIRGALTTVDRPLLGWMGRVFLHNVSHDHIAHHLFSSVPFYNLPEVTKELRLILGEDYNYDSSSTVWSLYRSFTQCRFVEDHGGILFYKDSKGRAQRELAGHREAAEAVTDKSE